MGRSLNITQSTYFQDRPKIACFFFKSKTTQIVLFTHVGPIYLKAILIMVLKQE